MRERIAAEDERKLDDHNTMPGARGILSRRSAFSLAVGIAVLAVLVRFWVSRHTHALGEDALITLRYADNIAAGRGWVYNPGERVLGTTTPLFTLILAFAGWLRLPAMVVGIACNIFADGVTCFLIARLLARPGIDRPVAGLFAALLYAVSSTPISVSISGMETALVACAGMAAISAFMAGRSRALCLWGAILFLLRIDGLLLFSILLVGVTVRQRRIPWVGIGLFLALVMPWLLFSTRYFGSPIPASVVAKLTVYSHTSLTPGSFTNTAAFNAEAFRNQFTLGWPQRICSALFVAGSLSILARAIGLRLRPNARDAPDGRQSRVAGADSSGAEPVVEGPPDTDAPAQGRAPDVERASGTADLGWPLTWLALYYGTMLTSHVPAFPWYFLPPWPLFVVVLVLGVDTLWRCGTALLARFALRGLADSRGGAPRALGASEWRAHSGIMLCALALFAAAGLVHVRSIERDIVAAQEREDTLRRPLGLWLRDHMASNERVLLEPIGYAGYYSGRRILDMVGLVSPEVLRFYRTPRALSGIVIGLRPEWLCLRAEERDRLHTDDPSLPGSNYELVKMFPSDSDPAFYLYRLRRIDRNQP